jgi:uncharacterized membrane protein
MDIKGSSQPTRRPSDSVACVLCYVLVPISSAFFLLTRRYGDIWPVRFHAFHSTLMIGLWAVAWGTLRLIEGISPWFLATLVKELRFDMNLGFIVVWAALLIAAYQLDRCAIVPPVHILAVRLARKSERQ